MSRYIDAERLMQKIERIEKAEPLLQTAWVELLICHSPTADVVEVRHGEWVSNELRGYKYAFYCSECGWVDGYPFNDRHKYCPNCGAKMDGERSENGT